MSKPIKAFSRCNAKHNVWASLVMHQFVCACLAWKLEDTPPFHWDLMKSAGEALNGDGQLDEPDTAQKFNELASAHSLLRFPVSRRCSYLQAAARIFSHIEPRLQFTVSSSTWSSLAVGVSHNYASLSPTTGKANNFKGEQPPDSIKQGFKLHGHYRPPTIHWESAERRDTMTALERRNVKWASWTSRALGMNYGAPLLTAC